MLLYQIQSSMDGKTHAETERIVSESDLAQLKACVHLATVTPQQRAMVETLSKRPLYSSTPSRSRLTLSR
ncbi:hypothetical protein [Paraburkholderia rhizosphaerae]|uniref:Uncharacterized protein n=1 Tax=Paraburkholderia rhizosphaerae TaxID=480658 RepID=A0A4R8LPC3_9BURK|nr:hypothetical protein [Paraburkholderia rhizosphaerae]TDY48158.1 hypothetical protein BX592_11193 [Paraburkholderia rhizosphaerae]